MVKKLVIKTIKEIKDQINDECIKYYSSKIDLNNTIIGKTNNKKN